jgi:hypothetical protein
VTQSLCDRLESDDARELLSVGEDWLTGSVQVGAADVGYAERLCAAQSILPSRGIIDNTRWVSLIIAAFSSTRHEREEILDCRASENLLSIPYIYSPILYYSPHT